MAKKARTRKDTLPSSDSNHLLIPTPKPEPVKTPPDFVWVNFEKSDTYEKLAGDTPVRITGHDLKTNLIQLNEAPKFETFEIFHGDAWVEAESTLDLEVVTVTLKVELMPYGDVSNVASEIESRLTRQSYERGYNIHRVTAKIVP